MTDLCIEEHFVRLSESNNADMEVAAVLVQQLSVPTVKTQVHLKAFKHNDGKSSSVSMSERGQDLALTARRRHLDSVLEAHRFQNVDN